MPSPVTRCSCCWSCWRHWGLIAAVVGVVVVLVSRVPGMAAHAGRLIVVGRVALALVGLVALPGFAEAIVDILGRGR